MAFLKKLFSNNHFHKNIKAEILEEPEKPFLQTIEMSKKNPENKRLKKLLKKDIQLIQRINKPHYGLTKVANNPGYCIELENNSKWFTNGFVTFKALSDINLKIRNQEFVVISGPSGSGKTTLLNVISGLDRASNGQTIVMNNNLITMSDLKLTEFRRRYVGFIFQQYGLIPELNVIDNIKFCQQLQPDYNLRLDIFEIINHLGLREHQYKYPKELSGGQQQRVAIARVLAKNSKILFGDEPTGAVDEKTSYQILKLFKDINEVFLSTIVIVTHNPIIEALATMIIRIHSGKIKEIIHQEPKSVDELEWVG